VNDIKTVAASFARARADANADQWAQTLEAHAKMMEILAETERRWNQSAKDIDCLRFACTDTLIAIETFVAIIYLANTDEIMHKLPTKELEANVRSVPPLLS